MFDLIGDIHGYAAELEALLDKLGYEKRAGVWQHPERRVIFLGDFVDRGPQQVETVNIARAMVEGGHALAVLGNHEFNAVAWATPDPQHPGEFLRPHTARNRRQHQAFLDQVGEGSQQHRAMIEWFKTLPVYLELDDLRVVHACWHPASLAAIAPHLDAHDRLLPEAWEATSRKGSVAYDSIETLVKGLEIPLPEGMCFHDKDGTPRSNVRIRWWRSDSRAYRDLAMVPESQRAELPEQEVAADTLPEQDGRKPIFIGHYWLTGDPAPLSEQVVCLDYSVAGSGGGKLCAYRFEAGEPLTVDRFVWVT